MADRDIELEPELECDNCGAKGAFDFMGDSICPKCLNFKKSRDNSTIEDGFGSKWSAWCPQCGKKSMSVVRPGKVQCNNCG